MHFVERRLHAAFSDVRVRKNREFFRILPERVKAALEIASGQEVGIDERDVVESADDLESLEKAKNRRPPFRFSMVNIKPGEQLAYWNNPEIRCTVVDDKSVRFEDQIMSLTKSAGIVQTRSGLSDSVAGTDYWTYDGTSLWNLRNQTEDSEG